MVQGTAVFLQKLLLRQSRVQTKLSGTGAKVKLVSNTLGAQPWKPSSSVFQAKLLLTNVIDLSVSSVR